jgi:hypothetical protein
MTDHVETITDRMATMPDQMDVHKKSGATMKKDKRMMDDQREQFGQFPVFSICNS